MAEIRRIRASADRKVTVTPLPDGVSEFYALLLSVQARQVYDSVNTLAHACAADDARTMDQRRADALMDLICGRADPPQVTVQVVVPVNTLLGESAEPAHVAGVGPITATEALQLAGLGNLGGCRDGVCRFPGCNRPATTTRSGTDLGSDGVMEWTSPADKTFRTEPWMYADTG